MTDNEKQLAAQAADEAFKNEMLQIAKNAALQSYSDRDLSAARDRICAGRRRFHAVMGIEP